MPRKSFVFHEEDSARLARMRAATRGRSPSGVTDLALRVLEDMVQAKQAGLTIVHMDKDGSQKTYDPLTEKVV